MKRTIGAALAAAALLASTAFATAKETVNIGMCVSWPGYAMHEIAAKQGLAPDYDINLIAFDDPLGGHAALAAGQIDIYECTGDYTPLAVERGTGVVNVAFANPSYGVDHIILAPDVEPSNIKGRRIAAPQAYIGQLLMGVWLDSVGVDINDVEWVNLNSDEAVGPMMSGDLAAAYLYEPWITKVFDNLPGSKSAIDTSNPYMLKTGIFTDVIYMNGDFIKKRRQAALDMLRARWDAIGWWHDHTKEGNQIMAEKLRWPIEDVESVIGTNGKFLTGGIYMYDFDEAARVCGVLDGDAPFELGHGVMVQVTKTINEWWVRLGLMKTVNDPSSGIDCSLLGDLVASGYRQTLTANP
jgi:NitT/TauT family transport system substrate-binding protein